MNNKNINYKLVYIAVIILGKHYIDKLFICDLISILNYDNYI